MIWLKITGRLTGIAMLVAVIAGAAMVAGKKLRLAGIVSGLIILLWAFARHLPHIATDPSFGIAWTNAGKALTLFGGAFAVAGTDSPSDRRSSASTKVINANQGFIYVG